MNKINILVVDDDADILRLMSLRLSSAGYQVITANGGTEALSMISIQRPDLIISDLRMPDIDGLSLMKQVQGIHPTLPFILLTAHGSIPEAVHATQQGAFSFLAKPFDSQVLLQQVSHAIKTQWFINA